MSKTGPGAQAPDGSLRAALEGVPDQRRGQGRRHPLGGVLALAVCAQLCGCRSRYAIAQWGQDCGPAIREAVGLSRRRGPCVATLHRVFRALDHAAYERVLGAWFATQGLEDDEAVAIDGKTLRGIHGEEIPGVHLVAAYAQRTRAVLAEAQTHGKGHELAGVKAVLAALPAQVLSGRVVTDDALLAQRELCRLIVAQKGGISSS
jgi:hypothetical protein